jgi:hypothetical protein
MLPSIEAIPRINARIENLGKPFMRSDQRPQFNSLAFEQHAPGTIVRRPAREIENN